MKTISAFAITFLALISAPAYAAVMFDWATVGNPGNADDIYGHGGVDYPYRISKHEVTNAQYAEFFNGVASTDSFGSSYRDPTLYDPEMGLSTSGGITRSGSSGSYTYAVKAPAVGQGPGGSDYTYDNKPVVYVSFYDAMRFVNWLHNGQGSGGTESGGYTISSGYVEVRSAGAKFWIPSEDEWYKAAYYDPNGNGGSGAYYDYPTSSDAIPNNNLPSADTGNSANFNLSTGNSSYPLTDVGAYTLSESPYGTFDQGGNVWEWTEGVIPDEVRYIWGGGWQWDSEALVAGIKGGGDPRDSYDWIGFRVARSIPEPSSLLLATLAGAGLAARRRTGRQRDE